MKPRKSPKKKITAKKKAVKKVAKKRIKREATRIVISPVTNASFVVASEIADDQIIEKELLGTVLPYFVYEYKDREGETIRGLTFKGVSEVIRRLNTDKKSGYKIRLNPDQLKIERDIEQNGEKGVAVTVFAENLIDANSAWGSKFEAYEKEDRFGKKYTVGFPLEKALSKAERNAKRKLIPQKVVILMIEKFIKENPETVQQLGTPPADEKRPDKAKASTLEEIQQLIRGSIEYAKGEDYINLFVKKAKEDKRFKKTFIKEIEKLAAKRIIFLKK